MPHRPAYALLEHYPFEDWLGQHYSNAKAALQGEYRHPAGGPSPRQIDLIGKVFGKDETRRATLELYREKRKRRRAEFIFFVQHRETTRLQFPEFSFGKRKTGVVFKRDAETGRFVAFTEREKSAIAKARRRENG